MSSFFSDRFLLIKLCLCGSIRRLSVGKLLRRTASHTFFLLFTIKHFSRGDSPEKLARYL